MEKLHAEGLRFVDEQGRTRIFNAIVAATYKDIGSGEKFIFSTRFRSTFWNWMMFIFLFGWIWMWF